MVHCLETIHKLNAEREAAAIKSLGPIFVERTDSPSDTCWVASPRRHREMIAELARLTGADKAINQIVRDRINDETRTDTVTVNSELYHAEIVKGIGRRDAEIAMLKEQLAGMEVQVKRTDSARGDATDSFYQWIHGKTAPGSRPSPKECYEAGYNNALAGIQNHEAVRAVVDAAKLYCSPTKSGHPYAACDEQLDRLAVLKRAVAALSAPSGPQQK